MRVKGGYTTRRRRKKWLKMAKGYYGHKHVSFRTAHEQLKRSFAYAFAHRRLKKREFRKLWIARINAAVRVKGLSYSRFMHGLKKANVEVNRKMLSEMAIHNPDQFNVLVELAKKSQ